MHTVTENEMRAVLKILKSPETLYNANSLANEMGISAMGELKILKRLEAEGILKSRQVGNASIYWVNSSSYAKGYEKFLLSKEAESSGSFIKRWISEIRKLKSADIAVLFGSVLRKTEPRDIDVLLVTDKKRFSKLKKEVDGLNKINIKKIHAVYQTFPDLVENIKKKEPVVLNAIKGIAVFGEEKFLEALYESRKE